MERRLHTRHRARTTVYITIPGGRRKLCRAVNLSATEWVRAIVARNDPAEQENVQPYPAQG